MPITQSRKRNSIKNNNINRYRDRERKKSMRGTNNYTNNSSKSHGLNNPLYVQKQTSGSPVGRYTPNPLYNLNIGIAHPHKPNKPYNFLSPITNANKINLQHTLPINLSPAGINVVKNQEHQESKTLKKKLEQNEYNAISEEMAKLRNNSRVPLNKYISPGNTPTLKRRPTYPEFIKTRINTVNGVIEPMENINPKHIDKIIEDTLSNKAQKNFNSSIYNKQMKDILNKINKDASKLINADKKTEHLQRKAKHETMLQDALVKLQTNRAQTKSPTTAEMRAFIKSLKTKT